MPALEEAIVALREGPPDAQALLVLAQAIDDEDGEEEAPSTVPLAELLAALQTCSAAALRRHLRRVDEHRVDLRHL